MIENRDLHRFFPSDGFNQIKELSKNRLLNTFFLDTKSSLDIHLENL